jgi:hypothetical protein
MKTTITLEIVEADGSIWLHSADHSECIGEVLDGLYFSVRWAMLDCLIKEQLESLALRMAKEASGPLPALKKEGK